MIDYLSAMLLNLAGGLFLLAGYVYFGLPQEKENQKAWAPGFLVVGLVAAIAGGHMMLTWPLGTEAGMKLYNSLFGEMAFLFGMLFLGAGLALAMRWSLMSVAIYGVLASVAVIVLGVQMLRLGLTKMPLPWGVGYILTGVAGCLVPVALRVPGCRGVRLGVALLLLAAGVLWLMTAYIAFWLHMADWGKPA